MEGTSAGRWRGVGGCNDTREAGANVSLNSFVVKDFIPISRCASILCSVESECNSTMTDCIRYNECEEVFEPYADTGCLECSSV